MFFIFALILEWKFLSSDMNHPIQSNESYNFDRSAKLKTV